MKIALIGPSIMSIPPKGWGAVEILIWNYKIYLEKLGHQVDIFSSLDLGSIVDTLNSNSYDFIHLQFDDYAGFLNKNLEKPYCVTSHYGYIRDDLFWDSKYFKFFNDALRAPGVIALSDIVVEKMRRYGYRGFLGKIRNGVEVDKFNFQSKGNGRAICLGKIDLGDRKCQVFLARILKNKVEIDFVGPCEYPNFETEGGCRYLGEWDKETVYKNLTNYSCLVLISKGEVAPLVIPEALAAGLSIVVSEVASANLSSQPFITIVPDGCQDSTIFSNSINNQIIYNERYRNEIRIYAEKNFDWKVIMQEYLDLIVHFNMNPRKLQPGSKIVTLKGAVRYLKEQMLRVVSGVPKKAFSVLQNYFIGKNNYSIQKQSGIGIAIIFIGTGLYIKYFPRYYKSIEKNFLPNTPKSYFVFTDDINSSHIPQKANIVSIHVQKMNWPFPTLFRFKFINKISRMLTTYSHIIFIDADMIAVSLVDEEDFFCHDKTLFGVQHPGFIRKSGPFESNLKSRAYVKQGENISIYWQACFFGGEKDAFLELTRELETRVDDDLQSEIVAVWHDESHLNKYYIEHKDNIYTYDPGYAYPESAHLPYQKKFVHLKKDHNAIRQIKTLWSPDKDRGADARDHNYWEEECFSNKWHSVEILYPFIDSYLSNEYLIRPLRVFEFGCIPCRGVVKFCRKYGGIPFGVDFSEHVLLIDKLAKREFKDSKFIKFDVANDDIDKLGLYDIVISGGFIEHFIDVDEIIFKHVKVLNKGGLLILTVPNLSFFRVLFWKIFDPKLMSIHNAQATDLKKVKKIIEKYKCTVLYYGRLKEVDLWLENSGGLPGRMGLIIIKIFKIFFRIFRIFPSISSPTCYWIAKKN